MSTSLTARIAGPRARFGLLLLGSLAGIMAAGGASAAGLDSDAPPSVVVKYSEQSLATDEGVDALYRRITSAARRVCPDAPIGNLGLQAVVQHCRNQAITQAVRQIDNPRLAALHAAHSKNG